MQGRSMTGNLVLMVAWALSGLGCRGDDQGPTEAPMVIEKSPVKSGDLQTGPVGLPLGNQLRVLVTKDGVAQSGILVSWSTSFGRLSASGVTTNAEGLSAVTWTLGPELGIQAATASLSGATGSPLTFTATATPGGAPPPTDLRIRTLRTIR